MSAAVPPKENCTLLLGVVAAGVEKPNVGAELVADTAKNNNLLNILFCCL